MLFRNYVNAWKDIIFKEGKELGSDRLLWRCLCKFIVMLMGCIIFRCWRWGQGEIDRGRMCQCRAREKVLTIIIAICTKIQTQHRHKIAELSRSHLPIPTPTNPQPTKSIAIQTSAHHSQQTISLNKQQ